MDTQSGRPSDTDPTLPAVELISLTKTWPPAHPAVADINLSIPRGQVYGLLGGVGAGKTVLLRLMAGRIAPSDGRVLVNGLDTVQQPDLAQAQVAAWLQGHRPKFGPASVWRTVTAGGGINSGLAEKLLRHLNLWTWRDVSAVRLSHGMQRKVALASALLANLPVLLLDEPTSGLDQQATHALGNWIKQQTKDLGRTVIVATGRPQLAQTLCQQVAIIAQGHVLAQLSAAEWSAADSAPVYQIRVKAHVSKERAAWFDELAVSWIDTGETVFSGVIRDQASLHGVLAKIRDMGLPLISATRVEPNLEQVFQKLTEGKLSTP